jgi:hypothetical protein
VIEWDPTAILLVVKVAVVRPAAVVTLTVARTDVPSLNCTVPVGVAIVVLPVTVAVKVTGCPKTDGLADDATVVVLLACVTVRGSQALVVGPLFASPP